MKKIGVVFGIGCMIIACSKKTTTTSSTVEPATKPMAVKTLSAEALQGKDIFDANCFKCHQLGAIKSYSEEKWRKIIPPMAKKSHITEQQEALVLTYVLEELK